MSTNSISSTYNLRHVAEKQALAHPPATPKNRKKLSPTKTATMTQDIGHNCLILNINNIFGKVTSRLIHSLSRFYISYSLSCTTWRGPTYLNGSSSTCDCESAHAALSPTLYDNLLSAIVEKLQSKSLDQLDPQSQKYLSIRFKLTADDKTKLSSQTASKRTSHITHIISRLSSMEQQGTFVNTPTGYARNATYENPRASNRFDCYLEQHLRPLEDRLADECETGAKIPSVALQELTDEYKKLIDQAVVNLKKDTACINQLQTAFEKMLENQSKLEKDIDSTQALTDYVSSVEEYLKAHQARFKQKVPGAPSHKQLNTHLDQTQSLYILKQVVIHKSTEYFIENKRFLKTAINSKDKFKIATDDITTRTVEAEHQLKILSQQLPEDAKTMTKYLFGKKDANGEVPTPSKEAVATTLLELIVPVTPSRSDLKKTTKKRPFSEISTSEIQDSSKN